jgi:hypothetical protein
LSFMSSFMCIVIKGVIEGIFNKVGWEGWGGGVSKSAFKAFGRQLYCRPNAKTFITKHGTEMFV